MGPHRKYMKRREFLGTFVAAAATWPIFAFAQHTQPRKRVGLMANLPLPPVQRFRERLQKLGWVEGKNLLIEYRYGEGGMTVSQNLRQNLCPCRWISWSFGELPRHLPRSAQPPQSRF